MNLLGLLLDRSRGIVLLAIVAGALSGLASAGLIALVQTTLVNPGPADGRIVAAFAALCGVVLVAKIVSQSLLIRLAQRAVTDLVMHLSRRVLSTPIRVLEEFGPHRVLALLTEDVPMVAHALLDVPVAAINLAVLVCCLGYVGWLSPIALGAIAAFILLGATSYHLIVLRALAYLKRAREEQDELVKHFSGLTDGAKELKLHRPRRLSFVGQLLEPSTARHRDGATTGMTLYAVAASWGQFLFFVAIGLVLFALPLGMDIPPPVLAGSVLTILFAASPLEAIMGWLPAFGMARVSLAKVQQLESLASETDAEPNRAAEEASIELRGVTHRYYRENEEGGFLLGPIDLHVEPGEIVFLVGGNGSGKTTLAKLFTGLYEPESGTIRLNGRSIGPGNREWYRQHFSAVFGDYFLFEQLLGLGRADLDAEAAEYLQRLRLDQKVAIRDGAFSTTALSHGQRKRLALVTAFLEDRPVYLFDEWAADQDPLFKEVFYTQLLPELRACGKAILVISHDDRYFGVADRIVKLDYGRLAAESPEHVPCTVA